MRQRKFTFLLVALLVALGLLFAGGKARAGPNSTISYSVVFEPGEPGTYTDTSGSYKYIFTQDGTIKVRYIEFAIPVAIPISGYVNVCQDVACNTSYPFQIFAAGVGDIDAGSKFAVGDNRVSVLKIDVGNNAPTIFTIFLNIAATLEDGKEYAYAPQLMMISNGNGAGSVWSSFMEDGPAVANKLPPLPTATISADHNSLAPGDCTKLQWDSTDAHSAVITSVVLFTQSTATQIVGPSGSYDVCPDDNTTYSIVAKNATGTSTTGPGTEATVTVGAPALPVIIIAQQTIEKKDPEGTLIGKLTFYNANDMPACACTTGPTEDVLSFPCEDVPLPTNCSNVLQEPLVVCIAFPGLTEAALLQRCLDNGGPNCRVIPITPLEGPCSVPGACYAKCDDLTYLTRATDLEIGPHSCTCTTQIVNVYNSFTRRYVPTPRTTCTGSPDYPATTCP